jgi:UDP-glucose 4-epimerase
MCRKYTVRKVIFASSGGAIYGDAKEIPTPETYPPNPIAPYSIHKLTGELYFAFYKAQFELDYTVLRYANVYGPRQLPSSEAGVVSKFINQLLRNEQPLLFTYPEQPDGMIRDYVYVQDLCVANALVLEKGSGETINIGSGIKTSTLTLYDAIADLLGSSVKPVFMPPRPGDIKENCLAIGKAQTILGWRPQTNLHRGLSATITYFNERYRKETE